MVMDSADQKLHLRLILAKGDFVAWLRDHPHKTHFLSVSSRDAPLRRMDGNKLTSQYQRDEVDKSFA